jgi:hypothetical protein
MRTPESDRKPPTAELPGALRQPYLLGTRQARDLTDDLEVDDLEISLRIRGYARQPPQNEKIRRYVRE